MINFSRDYYTKLFSDLENIKDEIIAEEFDCSKKLGSAWNTEDENGKVEYAFKKIPRKVPDSLLTPFTNEKVANFMQSDRIIAFTKIIVPSGQHVAPHYDNSYWGPEFFRSHIPLMDTEAYFTYGDEKIIWEKSKLYFFDVRSVRHSADNYSDKDFEFISIDIKIENEQ